MSSSVPYIGLGSALGMPQSALESITSLNPQDYIYPCKPSPAQQQAAMETLARNRGFSTLHADAGAGAEPAGTELHASTARYDTSIHLSDDMSARGHGGRGPAEPALALALESDCLKLLLGEDDTSATNGSHSDKSTATGECRVRTRRSARGMPHADCPAAADSHSDLHAAQQAPVEQGQRRQQHDDDEEDSQAEDELLPSDAAGIRHVASFQHLAHCAAELLLPSPAAAARNASGDASSADNSRGCTPRHPGPLGLVMSYEVVLASMNSGLGPEHTCKPLELATAAVLPTLAVSRSKSKESPTEETPVLARQGSTKRRRS